MTVYHVCLFLSALMGRWSLRLMRSPPCSQEVSYATKMIAAPLSAALVAGMLSPESRTTRHSLSACTALAGRIRLNARVASPRFGSRNHQHQPGERHAQRRPVSGTGALNLDFAPAAEFESQFTTNGRTYLIMRDTMDTCGFAVSTNQVGVIFQGYPVDYDVQPVQRAR